MTGLKHFGITPTVSVYQQPKTAQTPDTETMTVADVTSPALDGKIVKVEIQKPATLPQDLQGAKPKVSKGPGKNFDIDFPSDYERALYIVAQKRKSAADTRYRQWLKDTFKMSDKQIDDEAAKIKEQVKAAPVVEGRVKLTRPTPATPSESPEWVSPGFSAPTKPQVKSVTVKPVETDPVKNKKELLQTGQVAANAVAALNPTEAVLLNNADKIAKENGGESDFADSQAAVIKKLIRDFVQRMTVLDTTNWNFSAAPLSNMKKYVVGTKSMINAARHVPVLAPLVSAHDAVAMARQGIINLGLSNYQTMEKAFGRPRMRKAGQVLIHMQKTNQKIRKDNQGGVYYKTPEN